MADRANRQKTEQEPAEWLPPVPEARCHHVGERVTTWLRRQFTADNPAMETLKVFAEGPWEDGIVQYTPTRPGPIGMILRDLGPVQRLGRRAGEHIR